MLQIDPKNIIPITLARAKLDDLVTQAQGNKFFVISRQGKAKTAVIDVEYLMEMQKKLDLAEMKESRRELQKGFRGYVVKKGLDPDSLTEKEAEKILSELAS